MNNFKKIAAMIMAGFTMFALRVAERKQKKKARALHPRRHMNQ